MNIDHTQNQPLYLVGDVGGTNSRLALSSDGRVLAQTIKTYKNATAVGLAEVISRFLQESGQPECVGGCVAAAGPYEQGVLKMSNLDWVIDPVEINQATGLKNLHLLNDLQAMGYAVGGLPEASLLPIVRLTEPSDGTQLVVGVGTGFNAAAVHFSANGQKLVMASECGHAGLPVSNSLELEISQACRHQPDFASIEDVLSGRGLEALYRWQAKAMGQPASRPAGEITRAAQAKDDAVAVKTANTFARILGNVCGDLALVHLPLGGVFLAGGVVREVMKAVEPSVFEQAFIGKGRFCEHMAAFSISVVNDDFAALSGCADYIAGSFGEG